MFWLLAAGGPLSQSPSDNGGTTYVWANNWAAVIGIILCLVLLHMWASALDKDDEDDDSA